MSLTYVAHKKISLRKHSEFNEAWLHDRIAESPSILDLGDVRMLDRERTVTSGGRLDLLLLDEENNCRYEVEVMLGATDPSHIIRTVEYWDIERRRYPGYEHVAVLIAEDITTRFLNVMSLFAGSIPLIAIQLDALQVGDQILLNFVKVLDQTDLRIDDEDEDNGGGGGGERDREYWDQKAGKSLMSVCDEVLSMVNEAARSQQEFNYLQHYFGLRSNGVVKNFVTFSPKPTKKFVHIRFRNAEAGKWKDRFEEVGVPVRTHRKRVFWVSMTQNHFKEHRDLIRQAIEETVKEFDA